MAENYSMPALTQYEARVSERVRDHVAALMQHWCVNGHDDRKIEDVVKSSVLFAYVEGEKAAADAAYNAVLAIMDAAPNPWVALFATRLLFSPRERREEWYAVGYRFPWECDGGAPFRTTCEECHGPLTGDDETYCAECWSVPEGDA